MVKPNDTIALILFLLFAFIVIVAYFITRSVRRATTYLYDSEKESSYVSSRPISYGGGNINFPPAPPEGGNHVNLSDNGGRGVAENENGQERGGNVNLPPENGSGGGFGTGGNVNLPPENGSDIGHERGGNSNLPR